jgi:uncharacterized membrane protein YdbT with pleckstrin-like domain
VAYPRKLLNPGEEIVLDTRPNWSLLAGPVIVGLLLIAILIVILVMTSQNLSGWFGWLFLVLFVGDLCYIAARFITWRSANLVVTTQRVVYRHGVFRRESREIPIESIQDVSYRQTIFERMVGAGALTIESAGRQGQEPFPDVSRPAKLQSTINQLIEESRHRDQVRYSGQPSLSVPEQIEKLADLCQRGIITQDEFNRKKESLLREP